MTTWKYTFSLDLLETMLKKFVTMSKLTLTYLLAKFGVNITRRGQLEPRVGVGAGGALRAEAGEVVDAEDAADVPVVRTKGFICKL